MSRPKRDTVADDELKLLGLQHKGEAMAAGLPWDHECEACEYLRRCEAASVLGRLARGAAKRRGDSDHYRIKTMRRWAEVHRKAAVEAGKPWECGCPSCLYVREGRDEKMDQAIAAFVDGE